MGILTGMWWRLSAVTLCVGLVRGDNRPESSFEGPEPASAVLFLFAALAFGIIFRRTCARLVLPYTGLLLVRSTRTVAGVLHVLAWHKANCARLPRSHRHTRMLHCLSELSHQACNSYVSHVVFSGLHV